MKKLKIIIVNRILTTNPSHTMAQEPEQHTGYTGDMLRTE